MEESEAGTAGGEPRGGAVPDTWAALVPHRERAVAALRRRGVDPGWAEDAVHEAMLRIVQMQDVDHRRARSLLVTVAHRVAIDRHRRSVRETEAVGRALSRDAAAPDDIAIERDFLSRLAPALARLSVLERSALAGRNDGYTPRETAAVLGISPRSAHLALCRARSALKAAAMGLVLQLLLRGRHRLTQYREYAGTLSVIGVAAAVSFACLLPAPTAPGHPGVVVQTERHARQAHSGTQHGTTAITPATTGRGRALPQAPVVPGGARGSATTTAGVALERPGVATAYASVTRSNQNESFTESLMACLQPGVISLDPHHAGCSR